MRFVLEISHEQSIRTAKFANPCFICLLKVAFIFSFFNKFEDGQSFFTVNKSLKWDKTFCPRDPFWIKFAAFFKPEKVDYSVFLSFKKLVIKLSSKKKATLSWQASMNAQATFFIYQQIFKLTNFFEMIFRNPLVKRHKKNDFKVKSYRSWIENHLKICCVSYQSLLQRNATNFDKSKRSKNDGLKNNR